MSRADTSCVIALAGNPNVGKSTLFNRITGLRQHTGNWPGKTVEIAQGTAKADGSVRVVDLPGAYSLMAHSKEEEVARDFLLFERVDVVVVVCDATCLARNLNLALQALEMGKRCVVCVNLLDEAQRNHISLDLPRLEALLGVPVVGASARGNRGVGELLRRARDCPAPRRAPDIEYPTPIARAVDAVAAHMSAGAWNQRYIALRLLEGDMTFAARVRAQSGLPEAALRQARLERERLRQAGYDEDTWNDALVAAIYRRADAIAAQVVKEAPAARLEWQRAMDRLVTSRRAGIPLMLLLLTLVFFLTIAGANAPSQWLSRHLLGLQGDLLAGLLAWGAPEWLADVLANGVYRTLAWVVSVMLPPMAIFFPLFTLLEDLGYLPRVAFNLDGALRRCRACGKQALTMAMGFGCNAVGVMGCRIIDSPRERLVAILTNSLVPCNGRFPLLLLLIAMFFAGNNFVVTAVLLTAAVALGVFATFFASWLLSLTVLRGMPSAFALELPPYRRPQVGKVIVRSVLDRTAFVLGRAAMVAAPAGLLLWLMANVRVGGASLLAHGIAFFDPFAHWIGLDGTLFMAFLLGFPANEIVLPIALMGYLAEGALVETGDTLQLRAVLLANGWTLETAVCTLLFSLMHWPCSTTCLTIYRETRSWKWTLLAIFLPTALGLSACALAAWML